MAISASSTATGMLRGSILLVYMLILFSVFVVTRHFKDEMVMSNSNASSSEVGHVAKRSVGKWAKIRRGSFISPLKGKVQSDGNDEMKAKRKEVPFSLPTTTTTTTTRRRTTTTQRSTTKTSPSTTQHSTTTTSVRPSNKTTKTTATTSTTTRIASTVTNATRKTSTTTSTTPSTPMTPTVAVLNNSTLEAKSNQLLKENRRLPDCLIIGVRKGGTRAVLRFLRNHPDVKGVAQEVSFFSTDEIYKRGVDWYLQQLPLVDRDNVLIEKSAEYFHHSNVPERVYKLHPKMKLILVVRDPFERLVSDYFFLQRYAQMTNFTYPFEEIDHTLEELCIDNNTGKVKAYGGIHRSNYAHHTEFWLKFFPIEQLHIVNGDQIARENPIKELKEIEKFLGITPYFEEDFFFFNSTKGFYCSTMGGCLSAEKGHSQPLFDPKFENRVRSYLKPHNEKFYNMVGTNYNWATGYS